MFRKPIRNKVLIIATAVLAGVMLLLTCTAQRRIAVRSFLRDSEIPRPSLGAYGYVVFTKMPGRSDSLRYVKTCEAYRQCLPPAGEFEDRSPGQIMMTYWPLALRYYEPPEVDSCSFCIDHYDYSLGYEIASNLDKASAKGPLLVAWEKPFEANDEDAKAIIIDLSMFPDDELDRAFLIWRDRITRDPAAWQNGLKLLMFREAFRNALLIGSESIVSGLKL